MTEAPETTKRAFEIEKNLLLREREVEIQRLDGRVEDLMRDRVTTAQFASLQSQFMMLQASQAHISESLTRVEVSLYGPTGQNGLASTVRSLDTKIDQIRDDELKKLVSKIASFRTWAIAIVTTLLIVGATIAAAIITSR